MTKQYTYTKNKDGFMGSENRIKKTDNVEVADTWQLQRIADAMEEILRLVKTDMERSREAIIQDEMEEEQMKKKREKN
jgi:hypothetical protein